MRQSAKRSTYTGKTYNSLDNISQFFGERGMPFKPAQAAAAEAGFTYAAAIPAAHRQPSAAADRSRSRSLPPARGRAREWWWNTPNTALEPWYGAKGMAMMLRSLLTFLATG